MSSQPLPEFTPPQLAAAPQLRLHQGAGPDLPKLAARVRELGPWHQNIRLTEHFSTGQAFSESGLLPAGQNLCIPLVDGRAEFLERIDAVFPLGLQGKTLLDCACNAGAHSFWAAERNLQAGFGFDAREHWIRQARFVKSQRKVAPTQNLRFGLLDFCDLHKWDLKPADLTLFLGIFPHLVDPVASLRAAASLTREVIFISSACLTGETDGRLVLRSENSLRLMNSVDGRVWLPTGPGVFAELLAWLGFGERKLVQSRPPEAGADTGWFEIAAARHRGTLSRLPGEWLP